MRLQPLSPSRVGAACLALTLALLLAAAPAQAQWKWRDKSGQVNVSDRPPPRDVPERDILARPAASTDTRRAAPIAPAAAASAASAPVAAPAVERELEARRRAAEQEREAKARAEEEKNKALRAENCRRARGQLAALESGQRLSRVNAKGEREVLDDRGRADEIRQARDVIASDCR